MHFVNVDDVGHDVTEVFHLLRDDMTKIVPYLSEVKQIIVLEREEREDGSIRMLNEWQGSDAKVPRPVKKILKPDILKWNDHAIWFDLTDTSPRHAKWRLEPKFGGSLFTCEGTTSIPEVGANKCQIKVEGDLRVYPERFPGVPKFLAGRLRGKIESFVVSMLVPNMQTLARGVQNYFDDKKSGVGTVPDEEE